MPGIGSQPCPKPVPGLYRHQKRQAKAKALEEAYDVVNLRDGNLSRVSGCYLLAESPDQRQRREHHHRATRGTDQPTFLKVLLVALMQCVHL